MMKKVCFFLSILLGIGFCAYSQKTSNLRPKWVNNPPVSDNPTYYFIEVKSDASNSLAAARASVKQEIASNVERTDKVEVEEIYTDHSAQNSNNGDLHFQNDDSYNLNLKIEGSSVPITSRRIDEYWKKEERGGFPVIDYYALYAIERKGEKANFSNINVTSSYGAMGLWRSAIVPGWGQMYKGSYLKGGLILGGTVAIIGGIIWTESMRVDYNNKIGKTHSADLKKRYATDRDNWALGRNICIGGLAALYVYNIVDAIVAPGARRIVVHNIGNNGKTVAFMPTMIEGNAPGMFFDITF